MNPRHSVLETDVLPLNYTPKNLVGLAGLEPATSRLSGVRSNHLSYRPKKNGRGGETRTPGPMVPNHVRYQTALHLEKNMAEKEGFEPSRPLTRPTPLAGEPLQPLEYFSIFSWRRGWDSNPRPITESLIFKTSSLNRSDTSPRIYNYKNIKW